MELTTQAMREIMPLCAHMEMNLVRASPEEVVGSMEWTEATTTTGGAMHGGALMSLADTHRRGRRLPQPARGRGHVHDLLEHGLPARLARGHPHGDRTADPQGPYDDRGRDRADRRPGPPGGPYDADPVGADAADWVA